MTFVKVAHVEIVVAPGDSAHGAAPGRSDCWSPAQAYLIPQELEMGLNRNDQTGLSCAQLGLHTYNI